jgi:ankyrin repeat protein
MAAISGDTLAIRTLVAAGADPNFENAKGYTALVWAAEMGKLESISELCEAGAAVDHESKVRRCSLMVQNPY